MNWKKTITAMNIAAAALFVVGGIGFFWPGLYLGSNTLFLIGSVLFLLGAVASAWAEHGPLHLAATGTTGARPEGRYVVNEEQIRSQVRDCYTRPRPRCRRGSSERWSCRGRS